MQGRATLNNATDPSTGTWRRDNYYNYSDSINSQSYTYQYGVAGVSCIAVTMSTNCSASANTYWYLLQADRFFNNLDIIGFADPTQLRADAGLVNDSLCTGSCTNKLVRLDPSLGYDVMISNMEQDTCLFDYHMVTYSDPTGQAGMLIPPSLMANWPCLQPVCLPGRQVI